MYGTVLYVSGICDLVFLYLIKVVTQRKHTCPLELEPLLSRGVESRLGDYDSVLLSSMPMSRVDMNPLFVCLG